MTAARRKRRRTVASMIFWTNGKLNTPKNPRQKNRFRSPHMIVLGVILAILGYWLFPDFIPQIPPNLDSVCGGIGVVLIVIDVILWILGSIGRPVGRRRHYW